MTQILPDKMALIETAGGRWFPALTPLTDTPHWVTCIDTEARSIPPALEFPSCHDPKQGYSSREQALAACCAWDDEIRLPMQWETLAAQIEAYPERNTWYLEEIAQMAGEIPLLVTVTSEAVAVVVTASHPGVKVISAAGITRDEAIECLYQRVNAWWNGFIEEWAS